MATAESYWDKYLANKMPDTARGYRTKFDAFLKFTGLTHEKVFEMQKLAGVAEDPREGDLVVDLTLSFIKHLTEAGYAAGTIAGHVSVIKMFMESNKITSFLMPRDAVPYVDADGSHVITKDQFLLAWDSVSQEFKFRNRAILAFLKDSGLRIGDVSRITIRDYMALEDIGDGFKKCGVALMTRKRKRLAYLHLGPEATEAIEKYLEHRKNSSGKEYTIKNLGRIETRTYPVYDEGQAIFLGRGGKAMSVDSLGQVLSRILRPFRKVTAHSLRKFHTTNLQGAGMPEGWVKKLQGKAASVYNQPEKNGKLTAKYIECYDALRAFGAEKLKLKERERELEALRADNLILMKTIPEMAKALNDLRAEFEKYKSAHN